MIRTYLKGSSSFDGHKPDNTEWKAQRIKQNAHQYGSLNILYYV